MPPPVVEGDAARSSRRRFLSLLGIGAVSVAAGVGGAAWWQSQWTVAVPDLAEEEEPAAAGAPELGVEMFPDGDGRPLAPADAAPVIMVPRSAWTTQPPDRKRMAVMGKPARITVHHTAGVIGDRDGWKESLAEIQNIRDFHAGAKRSWADIAYHFLIDRAGRVWQGRPLVYQGAHAKGHNAHNIGIVLLGNFDKAKPAPAQLDALAAFILFLRDTYGIAEKAVYTHQELGQTSCPGKHLQKFMNRMRTP